MTGSARWFEVRRGITAVRGLVQVGADHGIPLSECLRSTGISTAALHHDATEIEGTQELSVIRNLVTQLGDRPGLGVEAGRYVTLGNLGLFGYALISSTTLREAAQTAARYTCLSNSFLHFHLDETRDDEPALIGDDADIPADVRTFVVERDLTVVGRVLPLILGDTRLKQLEVRLDAQRARIVAEQIPTISVRTDTGRNACVFAQRWLDQPLRESDAHTAELCRQQCQNLVQRRRLDLAVQLRNLLSQPGKPPSMTTISRQLSVDPRTLRRQLTAEHTTYRQLLRQTRESTAIELLTTTDLTVEHIAHRLGYSEPASFIHAFIQWCDTSPDRYRRTHTIHPDTPRT